MPAQVGPLALLLARAPAFLPLICRMIWIILGAGLLAVPLALDPVNVTVDPAISSKILLLRAVLGLWIGALGFAFALGSSFYLRPMLTHPLALACLFWFFAQLLSALLSGKFLWILHEAGHLILLPLLVWLTAGLRLSGPLPLGAVLGGATTGATLCALYGLGVMFGIDPLRSIYPFVYATDDARNFLHSFLGNPEYFGTYCAAMAAGGGATWLCGRGWIFRTTAAAFAALMLLCVILSGTRGALLGLLVVMALLIAVQWPFWSASLRRKVLQLSAILAVVGLVGVVILSTENPLNTRGMRLAQRFASLADPNSASVKERILFYAISAETLAQNPLWGSGPGTYALEFYPRIQDLDERDTRGVLARLLYDLRNRVAEQAHSDWLQAWSQGGIIGGATFTFLGAALVITLLYSVRRQFTRNAPWTNQQAASVAAAALATALYGISAFSFPLQMPARSFLFWGAIALVLAMEFRLPSPAAMPRVDSKAPDQPFPPTV